MGEHATLAPSSMARIIKCPGSVEAQLEFEDVTSEPAAEGTFAHAIGATCLTDGDTARVFLQYNPKFTETVEGFTFTLDEETCDHLQVYLDVCEDLTERASWTGVEHRVVYAKDNWGTSDFMALVGRTLHVVDLKFGRGIFVNVYGNAQARNYAMAALRTYQDKFQHVDTVVLHIVQPRHFKAGPDFHSSEEISRSELLLWRDRELDPGLERARSGLDMRQAGDHCLFCKAKAGCPELERQALETCRDVFEDVDTMEVVTTPPDPTGMTPDQIGAALKAFPAVVQWMEAVRAHAYGRVVHGAAVTGFKLVRKSSNIAWRDADDARLAFEMVGVDCIDAEPKVRTPRQAERLLTSGPFKGKPKKRTAFLDRLTHKPAGGLALVPDSDPREAVRDDDFDPFETITGE